MNYEIPREAFKQRLEDRLNFVLVDLMPQDKTPVKFENVTHLAYGPNFKTDIAKEVPEKTKNIILYSLNKGDEAPAKASQDLTDAGYHFVYYYVGSPDDIVLDKGMN